jgi:hypothetical protein
MLVLRKLSCLDNGFQNWNTVLEVAMWKVFIVAVVLALALPVVCMAGQKQPEKQAELQQLPEYENCPRPEKDAPQPNKQKARAAIMLDVIQKHPEKALDIMELLMERKMSVGLREGITTTCADYIIFISGNEKFDPPFLATGRIFGDFK